MIKYWRTLLHFRPVERFREWSDVRWWSAPSGRWASPRTGPNMLWEQQIIRYRIPIFLQSIHHGLQAVLVLQLSQYTVCPRSNDPFSIVGYYIKWVTTSWTWSIFSVAGWSDTLNRIQIHGPTIKRIRYLYYLVSQAHIVPRHAARHYSLNLI